MVTPRCLAILVCEGVVEDLRTRNKSLFNTYNAIWAGGFPSRHDRLTVFLSLTDGHGKTPVDVVVTKDGSPQPLLKVQGGVEFKNPLDVVDVVVDIRNLVLQEPGLHVVQVWSQGNLLAERRINVAQIPKTAPEGAPPA
jgi:hypothetical protein